MAGAIRVAIVGTDAEAQWWERQAQAAPQTRVVARVVQGPESGPRAQARWREIVGNPEVDAVCVCTPVERRPDLTISALEAGKHALVPLPVAANWESAQRMAEIARDRGALLRATLPDRHRPAIARMHAWITAGAIGDPLVLVCRAGRPAGQSLAEPQADAVEALLARAAGVASWLIGGFTAAIGLDSPTGETVTAIFTRAADQAAWVEASLADDTAEFVVEVTGRDGYASARSDGEGLERAALGLRDPTAPFRETVLESVRPDTYGAREWEEFVAAIHAGERRAGPAEAMDAMRLWLAARRSARSGVAEVA